MRGTENTRTCVSHRSGPRSINTFCRPAHVFASNSSSALARSSYMKSIDHCKHSYVLFLRNVSLERTLRYSTIWVHHRMSVINRICGAFDLLHEILVQYCRPVCSITMHEIYAQLRTRRCNFYSEMWTGRCGYTTYNLNRLSRLILKITSWKCHRIRSFAFANRSSPLFPEGILILFENANPTI